MKFNSLIKYYEFIRTNNIDDAKTNAEACIALAAPMSYSEPEEPYCSKFLANFVSLLQSIVPLIP